MSLQMNDHRERTQHMANFELISRLASDSGGKIILLVMDGLVPENPPKMAP